MNAKVRDLTPPVPDFWRALADGMDTQKADAFIDILFDHAGKYGSVTLTLSGGLILKSPLVISLPADIPRAKTKMRMICARLAVRCAEWSNRPVSPYGGSIEIVFPPTKVRFRVQFENTTASQQISIEVQSENGAKTT